MTAKSPDMQSAAGGLTPRRVSITRLFVFPILGLVCGGILGPIVGVIAGAFLWLCTQIPITYDAVAIGAIAGLILGTCVGFVSFFLTAVATCDSPQGKEIFISALQRASRNGIRNVVLGGVLAGVAGCCVASLASTSDPVASRHLYDLKSVFAVGYSIGALIGFLIGFIDGAVKGGQAEAQMQWLQLQIDHRMAIFHSKMEDSVTSEEFRAGSARQAERQ